MPRAMGGGERKGAKDKRHKRQHTRGNDKKKARDKRPRKEVRPKTQHTTGNKQKASTRKKLKYKKEARDKRPSAKSYGGGREERS